MIRYIELNDKKIEMIKASEEDVIKKLKDGSLHPAHVIDQPIAVQEVIASQEGGNIRFIRNPETSLVLKLLKQYPYAIQWMRDPIERYRMHAVRSNGMVLEFIRDKTEKVRRAALKNNALAAEFLDNITDEEANIMLDIAPESMRFINTTYGDINDPKYLSHIEKAVKAKPSFVVMLYNIGLIDSPLETLKKTNSRNLSPYISLWVLALERDPYLMYFLTEEEQDLYSPSIMQGLYKHPLGCSQLKNMEMLEYFIETFNTGVDKNDK